MILKEGLGLTHGQIKHFGDILTLVIHFQSLAVVALALTDITGHVDIGQKVHFHPDLAVTATCFATSAAHVKTEPSGLVATFLCFLGSAKNLADFIKNLGVSGRVGTRGPPDGRLVNGDNFLHFLNPFNSCNTSGLIHFHTARKGDMLVHGIHHKRTLARTGNPGKAAEHTQGNIYIKVLEVVGLNTLKLNPIFGIRRSSGLSKASSPRKYLAVKV